MGFLLPHDAMNANIVHGAMDINAPRTARIDDDSIVCWLRAPLADLVRCCERTELRFTAAVAAARVTGWCSSRASSLPAPA